MKVKWNDAELISAINKHLSVRIARIGALVETEVVRLISRDQPVKSSKNKERLYGLDPSKPGEPPKVLHGRLRGSITHKTFRDGNTWIAVIGSNVEYARALELGNPDTGLAARPYLRPGLLNKKKEILRILK